MILRRAMTLLMVSVAGCGSVQEGPSGARAPVESTYTEGEQLLAQPPAGWLRAGGTTGAMIRTAQFVPEDESAADWTRRITFEALQDEPLPDPLEFLKLIAAEQERACEGFESYPTFAGYENGYESAVHLLLCDRDRETGHALATMVKTIRGNRFFYVITRAKRGSAGSIPAEQQEVAAWSLYMKSIRLCDTDDPAHACPEAD